MLTAKKKADFVAFPVSVFETVDTKEDLEDLLLSHDSAFIKRMRKAREDDLKDKGTDWNLLKKALWTETCTEVNCVHVSNGNVI